MKKLLFVGVAMCSALFASAQNTTETTQLKEEYIVSAANENWYLTVGAGAQFHFQENNSSSLELPTMARFSFSAGKWFTPFVGIRATYAYTGLRVQSSSSANMFVQTNNTSATGAIHSLGADMVLHLSNLIGGYREDMRVYDAKLFGGLEAQLISSKGTKTYDYMPYIGLNNEFNLSKLVSLNLEVAAGYSHTDAFGQYERDLVVPVRASIGVTFYLGNGKSREFKTVTSSNQYIALSNINDNLNDQIEELKKSNKSLSRDKDALKKELDELKNQKKSAAPAPKAQVKVAPVALFFNTGSTKVSEEDTARLKYIAEIIKTESNTQFVVEGYADSATGSAKRNQVLSDKRAEAVCDILVNKYGVNRSQLEAKGMGATDSVFETMRLNRTVLVKSK